MWTTASTAALVFDWMVMALVKNLSEFEVLMWKELMSILGYDLNRMPPPVRRSWPTDGAPDWKINDDIVFMQVTENAADIMQPVDTVIQEYSQDIVCPTPAEYQFTGAYPTFYVPEPPMFMRAAPYTGLPPDMMRPDEDRLLILHTSTTRTIQLRLNAYGPGCYEALVKLRFELLRGRDNLKNNDIYFIPGADAIQHAPELFQGRWWKRADLNLYFNCLMVFDTTINIIEQVDVAVKANASGNSTRVLASDDFIIKKG